jgi:hypothetical protein
MIRNVRYKNRKQNLDEEVSSKEADSEKKNDHWENDINTDGKKVRTVRYWMETLSLERNIAEYLEGS